MRRLRKIQLPTPENPGRSESPSDDFPVFLVHGDWTTPAAEGRSTNTLDWRNRLSLLREHAIEALSARYSAIKSQLSTLGQRSSEIPLLWREEKKKDQFLRIALVALIAPLALLLVPRQIHKPAEKANTIVLAPPPMINLDDRLAFAEGLRDQLASRGVAFGPEQSPPPNDLSNSEPPASVEQPPIKQRTANVAAPDVEVPPIPPIAMDDQVWSLPFGSQEFLPSTLPETPDASFRSEIALSEIMSERAAVASNGVSAVTAPPKVARAIEKRKTVVAQKRRPRPAKVNQMTASATPPPAVVQPGPNLPPPPILFFLGAPPPQQP